MALMNVYYTFEQKQTQEKTERKKDKKCIRRVHIRNESVFLVCMTSYTRETTGVCECNRYSHTFTYHARLLTRHRGIYLSLIVCFLGKQFQYRMIETV